MMHVKNILLYHGWWRQSYVVYLGRHPEKGDCQFTVMNHESQEQNKRLQCAEQNKPAAINKETIKTQLTSKIPTKSLKWDKTKEKSRR